MQFRALISLSFAALVACASPPRTPAPADIAPVPFSAAQIREAASAGHTYVHRVTHMEGTMIRKYGFTDVGPTSATVVADVTDADGRPMGETSTSTVTWEELVTHAHYPAANTTIESTSVVVPAGKFDCKLYTVMTIEAGVQRITRAWFALELPGAPVRHEITEGSRLVSKMELLQLIRLER